MPIEALATVLMLVVLAIIVYGPWQTYCTDYCRQVLFELRDEVFDLAADNNLSFESNEYRTIRAAIERNIRFAHTLTFWRFALMYLHFKHHAELGQKSEITRAIEGVADSETREKLNKLFMRVTKANLKMMVAKSPLLILILAVGGCCLLITHAYGKAKSQFWAYLSTKTGDAIQIEAETACA